MGGACSTKESDDSCIKIVVAKAEGKRSLERHRSRWEDNIRIDVRKIGREVWTGFIWLRIGNSGLLL
jgi:hypothetical protein